MVDLAGQVYGCLTVVSRAWATKKNTYWFCRCSCGGENTVRASHLKSGDVTSCGCLSSRLGKHNLSQTTEYKIWYAMKRRCLDRKQKNYQNYGGRGIKICDRWDTFENFLSDMGARPSSTHSIDRIDNDGDYEPNNCRWATRSVQNSNARSNRLVSYRGETITLTEAIRRSGTSLPKMTIISRMNIGLSLEEALTRPRYRATRRKSRNISYCMEQS